MTMPDLALPTPRPRPLEDTVHLHRAYRDPLGRPLRGAVKITPARRSQNQDTVVPAVTVEVPLVGGILDVHMPPGTYRLSATLTSATGSSIVDDSEVTLTP